MVIWRGHGCGVEDFGYAGECGGSVNAAYYGVAIRWVIFF